ncbi:tachykinin-like peptides receptor 99D isoform X2 [Daphnia pulex]|uniref:tachykinin-like peptides receptor 99D isoform X2 n=1 Tax=Daphnia pulex TaxID=6669 RepID=UPI001EE02F28|nr:tachykinin-like peptides receptor 99D isoform X2 [Daphnia pulex]
MAFLWNDGNLTIGDSDVMVFFDHSGFNWTQNNSLLEDATQNDQFSLPWWRIVLWTMLFAVMVVVSTGGNLIVIWIVLADRRMRTVTNYFLVNLSIADTMVSTLNVIFNFISMVTNDWPFGRVYCKISQFVAVISICGSVFTLMAISIERYLAIMYPLRRRMGKMTTIGIALSIWLASFLISTPHVLYSTTITYNDSGRTACYLAWPDGPTFESYQEYIYNVMLTILTYFLPICAMGYAYFQVGVELWGSQGIGECTDHQMENVKSKRRVVKMMIVVVTIFAICWLPYHIYFIVSWLFQEINQWSHIQEIYLGTYWLAMSNAMYNPIIYCWMNSRFRKGFRRVFYFWFRCFKHSDDNPRNGAAAHWNSCPGSPDHVRSGRNGGTSITMMPLHHLNPATARYDRNRLPMNQQRPKANQCITTAGGPVARRSQREEDIFA